MLLHAVAAAASPAGTPAVAGDVESAFRRARRSAARTPVIQRRPPTARWAEVIATAFAVQTDVAPSATCAARRTSQRVDRVPRPGTPWSFRRESAAATTRATTTQANGPVREVGEDSLGGPLGAGRDDPAEREGPVGDREPGARVADDRAEEDLDVARPGGPEREPESLRECGRVGGGAGRHLREAAPEEGRPERDRRGEGEDDLREPRVRGGDRGREEEEDRHSPEDCLPEDGAEGGEAEPERGPVGPAEAEDEDLQADHRRHGGRDEPVAVLVEDPADHRRHQLSVGERPVGDGEAGAGRRHERPRDEQEEDRYGDGAGRDADGPAGRHRSPLLRSGRGDAAAGEAVGEACGAGGGQTASSAGASKTTS